MAVIQSHRSSINWRRQAKRARLWARRVNFSGKYEVVLGLFFVVSAIATYIAISRKATVFFSSSTTVRVLLVLDLIFLAALSMQLMRRWVGNWYARRSGTPDSKLLGRVTRIFALVAIVPPILMAIFMSAFIELGIENWFSATVRSALSNSRDVAVAYVNEHRQSIRGDILAIARDLNRESAFLENNTARLRRKVAELATNRSVSEAIVFDGNGKVLARMSLNIDLTPNRFPNEAVRSAQNGQLVILSSTEDDRVAALLRLGNFIDAYLYVSRFVDPQVLAYVETTRTSIEGYEFLEEQRSSFELKFNLAFLFITLVILLAAITIGLWFAIRLVDPISRLVVATERVRHGDLTSRVPALGTDDEIGALSRRFNRMTEQLERQHHELIDTNRQLDDRRRFSEAVLSGVSAGVLGVGVDGRINLPNRSACQLLGMGEGDLTGMPIAAINDEFGDLFSRATENVGDPVQGQVDILKDDRRRHLLVRIGSVGGEEVGAGYVVTFDDVTEQLADQRTAAWADVARRIAHEIKNPLTPIQLSAERLKRKYSHEIKTDPSVFTQCTDTIIRQVGDLRRMVDEFSSFSRMPAPVFRETDINDITKQAVFLQDVAYPDITFETSLAEGRLTVRSDGRLLSQALTNLMKNGAESILGRLEKRGEGAGTHVAGLISVSIATDDKGFSITIGDNGLGLPTVERERLTEPYVTTRSKGTGLGLAIVKRIVEEHGGELTLEDEDGGGARVSMAFTYTALERKERARADAGDPKTEATGLETMRKVERG